MHPDAQMRRAAIIRYSGLMVEITERITLVHMMAQEDFLAKELLGRNRFELAYLQIRMICELIALACLLIHEEVPGTERRELQHAYHPEKLIKEIEKLHPEFFPCAAWVNEEGLTVENDETGGRQITKEELLKIWSKECGEHLHRGRAESLQLVLNREWDLRPVDALATKLEDFLFEHRIFLLDQRWQLTVQMRGAPGRRPRVGFMERTIKPD